MFRINSRPLCYSSFHYAPCVITRLEGFRLFCFPASNKNDLKQKLIMKTETIHRAYESPQCEIVEIRQEGGFCTSVTHNPYEEDDFVW